MFLNKPIGSREHFLSNYSQPVCPKRCLACVLFFNAAPNISTWICQIQIQIYFQFNQKLSSLRQTPQCASPLLSLVNRHETNCLRKKNRIRRSKSCRVRALSDCHNQCSVLLNPFQITAMHVPKGIVRSVAGLYMASCYSVDSKPQLTVLADSRYANPP